MIAALGGFKDSRADIQLGLSVDMLFKKAVLPLGERKIAGRCGAVKLFAMLVG